MAFKILVLLSTVAIATQAASFWPNQQQQIMRMRQQGGSPWPVSRSWAWNDKVDRQHEQWNQEQQWNGQWNRNWENNNNNNNNNNDWSQQERQQWQQRNWNRNWNEESNEQRPRYESAYEVRDPRTGDFKAHQESRDGDNVSGQYSMLEADGSRRVVEYTADNQNGFNANVRRDGWSRHD